MVARLHAFARPKEPFLVVVPRWWEMGEHRVLGI
jgi:hypothetical protein